MAPVFLFLFFFLAPISTLSTKTPPPPPPPPPLTSSCSTSTLLPFRQHSQTSLDSSPSSLPHFFCKKNTGVQEYLTLHTFTCIILAKNETKKTKTYNRETAHVLFCVRAQRIGSRRH